MGLTKVSPQRSFAAPLWTMNIDAVLSVAGKHKTCVAKRITGKNGEQGIQVMDYLGGGIVEAYPKNKRMWLANVWTLGKTSDYETTRLAMEILKVERPEEGSRRNVPLHPAASTRFYIDSPLIHAYVEGTPVLRSFFGLIRQTRLDVRMEPLVRRAPGISVIDVSMGSHSYIAEGTWHGWEWVFTYDHAVTHLVVGGTPIGEPLWSAYIANDESAHPERIFGDDVFFQEFCKAANVLDRAPYDFPFERTDAKACTGTDATIWWERGHTAKEAHISLTARSPFTFNPEPLSQDKRVFPEKEPKFYILPDAC